MVGWGGRGAGRGEAHTFFHQPTPPSSPSSSLVQLAGFRYGALVVAHETGGLRDTIVDASRLAWPPSAPPPYAPTDVGSGWLFSPPEAADLTSAVHKALDVWRHQPERWVEMRRAAASQDVSWDRAAAEYEAVMVGVLDK